MLATIDLRSQPLGARQLRAVLPRAEYDAMVEANELMTLERLVNRHLDSGEAEAMRAEVERLSPGEAPAAPLLTPSQRSIHPA